MSGVLNLIIRTPEKEFYNGEITELITENELGQIGILHKHVAIITNLVPAITIIKQADGKTLKAFTSTGILSVKNDKIEFLCDACEWPEDINLGRAEEAKKRAEERLNNKSGINLRRAELALNRALHRITLKK